MSNTADVTGGKPIAVLLQSISDVSAINPIVALYDIHGRKREVLLGVFFYFVPNTTRDCTINIIISQFFLNIPRSLPKICTREKVSESPKND
jgi:hypothetical protein